MEFVPSLQGLDLDGVRLLAPSRNGAGAGAGASVVRNGTLRALSPMKCQLDGDDLAFVYHLEGLEKLELNETKSKALRANAPAWGDLLRRMPALRALQIKSLDLIDDALISSIAENNIVPDHSVFESLDLTCMKTDVPTVRYLASMGSLLPRLRGAFSLDGLQWSVSNVTFISDALASGSELQHWHLGFVATRRLTPWDEWYELLFRALCSCRRLESVQLTHDVNTVNTIRLHFTSLQVGTAFREWIGSSTTLQSRMMHTVTRSIGVFLPMLALVQLRSSSLVSMNFRITKIIDDLSVFGQALVEGATLQETPPPP